MAEQRQGGTFASLHLKGPLTLLRSRGRGSPGQEQGGHQGLVAEGDGAVHSGGCSLVAGARRTWSSCTCCSPVGQ